MIVPNEIRKCVVFIGFKMADGSMRMAGSGFFLGKEHPEGHASQIFLVTAKHVIDGIRRLGIEDVYLRANLKNGSSEWIRCPGPWAFHPDSTSVDLALHEMGIPAELDHLAIPHALCATPEKLLEHEVGLGDEVFVVGLFRHHAGESRNIPIVRVGNLAAMAEERVVTRDFGQIDAYLVEARSIGGLSGSAVFLNLGIIRHVNGQIRHSNAGPIFMLLGLIHGHFDVSNSAIDAATEDRDGGVSVSQINTGIAIVVPMQKIFEAIAAYNSGRQQFAQADQ